MIKILKVGLEIIALIVFIYLIKEKTTNKNKKLKTPDESRLSKAIKKINIKYLECNPKHTKTNNGISFDKSPMLLNLDGIYFDQNTKTILGFQSNGSKTQSEFIPCSNEHKEACYYAYKKYSGEV